MATRKRSIKKNDTAEGKKLNYNASEQNKYASEIRKLFLNLVEETERKVLSLFRKKSTKEYFEEYSMVEDASISNEFSIIMNSLFDFFNPFVKKKANKISKNMVDKTVKYSSISLKNSLRDISEGVEIKTSSMSSVLKEIIAGSVKENVSLITSLQTSYLSSVEKMVNRAITSGQGLKDIEEDFSKRKGITLRHAKNMALDQTRKVYSTVNAERMKSSGIKKFIWLHSGGGQHPRPDHVAMSGKEFSFDDLPVIDKNTGETGIPGQAINCKCTMKPVIDFGD